MVGAERRWDRDHISYRGSGRSGMEIGRGKLYDDHRWQDGRNWYTPGQRTLVGNDGMEYTFVQEGTGQDGQEASSSSGSFATFTCYGNLYAVRYPTDLFQQDPAGLSDLYTEDGVKGWITKLDTEERVTEWLAGFDEKETNENVQDYQTMEYTVAGYPARAIVYQDAEGWHSEVIVNFGKDMGNETYSMYAAYIYFTGDTYVSVWNEEIQGMINSLSIDG